MQVMLHLHMQVDKKYTMKPDNNMTGFKYSIKEAKIWLINMEFHECLVCRHTYT